MQFVIFSLEEFLYYSGPFSWCNLAIADRFTQEERDILPLPENSKWMTLEEAETYEEIPWTMFEEEIENV